ncbi:MAG TPA: Fic family protein [Planctomycetes bacterium]|nr:Fic family protein [Planctomycetota bacterium]
MEPPKTPPPLDALLSDPELLARCAAAPPPLGDAHDYPHWDTLSKIPGEGESARVERWYAHRLPRRAQLRDLPQLDGTGRPFRVWTPPVLLPALFRLDRALRGDLLAEDPSIPSCARSRGLTDALIEEAVRSAQLDGAPTTTREARELLRSRRGPRTRGERMIRAQLDTLEWILASAEPPLDPDLVLETHRRLHAGARGSGRLRTPDEPVRVLDPATNAVLHTPPPAEELQSRLEALCAFANGTDDTTWLHPILRAILVHFWVAQDQPFPDANCRAARTLFYRTMLQHGYRSAPYVSISAILKREPPRYGRAFLLATTDENDATHFVHFHLRVLERALATSEDALSSEERALQELQLRLPAGTDLNPRQLALLARALRAPHRPTTIRAHQNSHRVTYQTARTDLLALEAQGLFSMRLAGRTMVFRPRKDLLERLSGPEVKPEPTG